MTRVVSNAFSLTVQSADAVPSWVSSAAFNSWFSPPGNTTMATAQTSFTSPFSRPKENILAFSGAALKLATSEIFIAGGGHTDYAGNEVYSFPLLSETPQWDLRRLPTPEAQISWNGSQPAPSAHYSDGRPVSRHTYWNLHFHESLNRLFFLGAKATWGEPAGSFLNVDAFNAATNDYDAANTYTATPFSQTFAAGFVKVGLDVYAQMTSDGRWYRWNASNQSWTTLASRSPYNGDSPFAYDSSRGRILRAGSHPAWFDVNNSLAETTVTFSGANASSTAQESTMIYVPDIDRYLLMRIGNSTVYQIHPTDFTVTTYSLTGTAPTIPSSGIGLLYGRLMYVPAIKCVAVVATVNQNVKLFRVA